MADPQNVEIDIAIDTGSAKAFSTSEIEMSSQNKGVAKITFSPPSTLSYFKGTIKLTAFEILDINNCPSP